MSATNAKPKPQPSSESPSSAPKTAKLFKNGRSQAVRLPKEFRFEGNEVASFPIFAKIDVNGAEAHPLFKYLKRSRPGLLGIFDGGRIRWNFTKFLVNREGNVVERFGSTKTPESLAGRIEALLGEG